MGGLNSTFFIPCDSHGLQLLLKDILELPKVTNIFNTAKRIVAFFRSSPKQHAILQDLQLKIYKKQISLISSVITQWGSQYRMLHSIHRSNKAIRQWAKESPTISPIKSEILSPQFWELLADLVLLIEPIHTRQLDSKDTESNISTVSTTITRIIALLII